MSKDPAILFYTSDFLTQCTSLTMAERGEYITLLCLQHQLGHLDWKTISLSIGFSDYESDVLALFKQDENGYYYNEWLEDIIIKRKEFTESRRKNRLGKTKKHNKNISNSYEKLMENGNENENIDESVIKDENTH